jgi:hypothetical protein
MDKTASSALHEAGKAGSTGKAPMSRLLNLVELNGSTIIARDGEIGKLRDTYFDDDAWVVRYLVVDVGHWLPGRRVLLAPMVLQSQEGGVRGLHVSLTKEQVEQSPDVSTDLPVSRQKRIDLHRHYSWPVYWVPSSYDPWPISVPLADEGGSSGEVQPAKFDPHLRSVHEVTGYHLAASDGDIGHVVDFLANEVTWEIRYLVVKTGNWLPGRRVLIPPYWLVRDINWPQRSVEVALTQERIRNSPSFDPHTTITPEVEQRFHDYYGSPTYGSPR